MHKHETCYTVVILGKWNVEYLKNYGRVPQCNVGSIFIDHREQVEQVFRGD